MRNIKIINKNNEYIEFNNTPYILNSINIENDISVQTSKSFNDEGEKYISSFFESKIIEIKVTIIADNEVDLARKRVLINGILNPKLNEIDLIYSDEEKERKIKCILTKLPNFNTINFHTAEAILYLKACKPFFEEIEEIKASVAIWRGAFKFPLILSKNGLPLGYRQPDLIVNISNNGDVETGMLIEFKALGTVVNPSFLNVNTREFIKIKKILIAGEIVKVNTNKGSKKIISTINDVETNILNLIDLDSTFLQLEKGDNLFRYDAEENLNNLEVSVYYNPKYLGV